MLNSIDIAKIADKIADHVRVYASHYRVDLTSRDIAEVRNFIQSVLSNYQDDQHIQNTQLNPKTGQVEVIGERNQESV